MGRLRNQADIVRDLIRHDNNILQEFNKCVDIFLEEQDKALEILKLNEITKKEFSDIKLNFSKSHIEYIKRNEELELKQIELKNSIIEKGDILGLAVYAKPRYMGILLILFGRRLDLIVNLGKKLNNKKL